MKIGQLKPARGATHAKKRRGLGPASGLGGTAGRGHKGQRARSGKGSMVPGWFEGGQMPIQRRLPKRGFTNVNRVEYQAVNVGSLTRFSAGEKVTRETLRAKRLISGGDRPVKLLGEGEVKAAFEIAVDAASATARLKIEAAGGTLTLPDPRTRRKRGEKKERIPRPHDHGGPKSARGRKPGGGGHRVAGVQKPGGGGPKSARGRKPGAADRG
jgi:large subunit ribosomal protein L15